MCKGRKKTASCEQHTKLETRRCVPCIVHMFISEQYACTVDVQQCSAANGQGREASGTGEYHPLCPYCGGNIDYGSLDDHSPMSSFTSLAIRALLAGLPIARKGCV